MNPNLDDGEVKAGSSASQQEGTNRPSIFRFTIWHVMLLMTAVAVVYSIDDSIVVLIMGIAVCGLLIAPLLLVVPMLTRTKRSDRPAKIERALIRFLTHVTVWSAICIIFIVAAITLKYLVSAMAHL